MRTPLSSVRLRAVLLMCGAMAAVVWRGAWRVTPSMAAASSEPAWAPADDQKSARRAWIEEARSRASTLTRDPFRSPVLDVAPSKQEPARQERSAAERIHDEASHQLTVRAIMTGASRAAMINGQVVREGDSVAGFIVKRIDAGSVTVERAGIEAQLEFR